jgi:hypothetical protein
LFAAAYGFGDIIRDIRGQCLPTDNAGHLQQPDARVHPTRFVTGAILESMTFGPICLEVIGHDLECRVR